jgi:hypothetical protein
VPEKCLKTVAKARDTPHMAWKTIDIVLLPRLQNEIENKAHVFHLNNTFLNEIGDTKL